MTAAKDLTGRRNAKQEVVWNAGTEGGPEDSTLCNVIVGHFFN